MRVLALAFSFRLAAVAPATEADFQKTTERVYHSRTLPSSAGVGVLPR